MGQPTGCSSGVKWPASASHLRAQTICCQRANCVPARSLFGRIDLSLSLSPSLSTSRSRSPGPGTEPGSRACARTGDAIVSLPPTCSAIIIITSAQRSPGRRRRNRRRSSSCPAGGPQVGCGSHGRKFDFHRPALNQYKWSGSTCRPAHSPPVASPLLSSTSPISPPSRIPPFMANQPAADLRRPIRAWPSRSR